MKYESCSNLTGTLQNSEHLSIPDGFATTRDNSRRAHARADSTKLSNPPCPCDRRFPKNKARQEPGARGEWQEACRTQPPGKGGQKKAEAEEAAAKAKAEAATATGTVSESKTEEASGGSSLSLVALLGIGGLIVSLLGVYYQREAIMARLKPAPPPQPAQPADPAPSLIPVKRSLRKME